MDVSLVFTVMNAIFVIAIALVLPWPYIIMLWRKTSDRQTELVDVEEFAVAVEKAVGAGDIGRAAALAKELAPNVMAATVARMIAVAGTPTGHDRYTEGTTGILDIGTAMRRRATASEVAVHVFTFVAPPILMFLNGWSLLAVIPLTFSLLVSASVYVLYRQLRRAQEVMLKTVLSSLDRLADIINAAEPKSR